MGFDFWEPVQSNARLLPVLESFSQTNPPPPSISLWTLDALFGLPRARIKYYQKLYGRLLKNSAPGKSTDKLLISAVEKLERLLSISEERAKLPPLGESPQQWESIDEGSDTVVIDTTERSTTSSTETMRPSEERIERTSVESSAQGSSFSSE